MNSDNDFYSYGKAKIPLTQKEMLIQQEKAEYAHCSFLKRYIMGHLTLWQVWLFNLAITLPIFFAVQSIMQYEDNLLYFLRLPYGLLIILIISLFSLCVGLFCSAIFIRTLLKYTGHIAIKGFVWLWVLGSISKGIQGSMQFYTEWETLRVAMQGLWQLPPM